MDPACVQCTVDMSQVSACRLSGNRHMQTVHVCCLPAALLCGISMVRVDWEQEAEEAQKHSIARQADRLSQHPSNDGTDVENMLDGIPEESSLPGECISVACSNPHNAEPHD